MLETQQKTVTEKDFLEKDVENERRISVGAPVQLSDSGCGLVFMIYPYI